VKTTEVRDGSGGLMGYVFIRSFDEGREPEGVQFLTPDEAYQQVAYIRHGPNHEVPAHTHLPTVRKIVGTPETLIVLAGGMILRFHTLDGKLVEKFVLGPGDSAVLVSGGHSIASGPRGVELFEVKQGPYHGIEADKYLLPRERD